MGRVHVRPLGLAAVLIALSASPALAADTQVRAVPLNRYETPEVTMNAGDRLVFANADVLSPHNLTAVSEDPAGTPLFATPTLSNGQTAVAAGSDELPAGSYGFFCTIHPTMMRGRVEVTGVPDTRPPTATAALDGRRLTRVEKTGRLPVTIQTDESGGVTARARSKGHTVAKGASGLKPGTTRLSLKLTQAGRRLLRRTGRLSVTITFRVTDLAGNAATVTATRVLRG